MLRWLMLIHSLILIFLVILPTSIAVAQSENNSVISTENTARIGVLAYRGADATLTYWEPLVNYLSEVIPDWRFELVPLTLVSAIPHIENKRLDFFITNPGHFVTLENRYRLSALSTRERLVREYTGNLLEFGSVIFVRRNSKINVISDLKNRSIAAVSQNAFGGFQIAWNEMREQGIDPFQDLKSIRYMGFPQDMIVKAVLEGEVDAGIIRTGLLEALVNEGRMKLNELRVLNSNTQIDYPFKTSSRLYPEWPFSSLPGINRDLQNKVLLSLLATQDKSVATKFKLPDIWSAPLSYNRVRYLTETFKTELARINAPKTIWLAYVIFAAAALLLIIGFVVVVWFVLRSRETSPEVISKPAMQGDAALTGIRKKFDTLTPREREILDLVCNGGKNKDIAEALNISPKTVEFHRTNLLHKTESETTAHLVQLATRLAIDQG